MGNKKIAKTVLEVPLSGEGTGAIQFRHPQMKVKPKVQNGEVTFELSLKANGTIRESLDISIRELEDRAERMIENEIRHTFQTGLSKQCDPFQLEESLYRRNPGLFHQLAKGDSFFLNERSLGAIRIKVDITSTGKYKEDVR